PAGPGRRRVRPGRRSGRIARRGQSAGGPPRGAGGNAAVAGDRRGTALRRRRLEGSRGGHGVRTARPGRVTANRSRVLAPSSRGDGAFLLAARGGRLTDGGAALQ